MSMYRSSQLLAISLATIWSASALPLFAQSMSCNVPSGGSSSPTAPIVFTFSEPMDTSLTEATFIDTANPMTPLNTVNVWSSGNTILTCTPSTPLITGHIIGWNVDWTTAAADPVSDSSSDYFFVGSGGGGGSGTNRVTTFSVGISHFYDQTSSAPSVLDADIPYNFSGLTMLASNRTATSITLTLQNGGISNLVQNPFRQEMYQLFTSRTNLSTFNTLFPSGNYIFNVYATASNQQVTVNLPASLTQPNGPHISNFTAAQSVVATQSFQLTWDAFTNGTTADYISVDVGGVIRSPDIGAAGALNGTATAFTIPANTLQPNSNYNASVIFYKFVTNSINSVNASMAYRASYTSFPLITTGAIAPVLTNYTWAAGKFSFDVISAAGQPVTILYSTNLLPGGWYLLQTTNNPGTAHITDPRSSINRSTMYRARTGS
jgi:hypothetical protein